MDRLGALAVTTAVLSAFLDNLGATATLIGDPPSIMIAMIPVVEQLGGAEHDAYWWALALGACFGGNATLVAAAANVAAAGMAARAGRSGSSSSCASACPSRWCRC